MTRARSVFTVSIFRFLPRARAGTALAFYVLAAAVTVLVAAARPAGAQTDGLGMPPPQAPGAPEQIEANKLTKLPKQTKFVEAEYPKEALEKGINAEVVLTLDINAEGKVDAVAVTEPANPPGMGFDEAAMAAAQAFEFEPAEMGDKKIAVQITYRYKFALKTPPPAAPAAPPVATGPPGAPGAATTAAAAAAARATKPVAEPVVNFKGILRERGTRLLLPGLLVTVFRDDGEKPMGFEASSDATGTFQFYDLAPGEWKVLIEPPGFYPYRTTETIHVGERTEVTYYIERGSYNPFDVTVTATRPKKEVSRTVISAKEIDKIPGTFGDPLAVIQNFAGVARAPLTGQIIIRGSSPQDSKILVDGAEVPLIYHFGALRSVLPVGILDSIEFYPGNFSPMYGRATGGIVDVQIKKLQPEKIGGYADVNLFDTGVFLEVPLGKKGGIAIAGRRSYIDYILNAVVPSDAAVNLVTAPRYYDYQLLANYRPAPAHDLRALFFGSDDRLELLFKNPANFDPTATSNVFAASTSFYRGLLTYRYTPSDIVQNDLRISGGRNQTDFSAGNLVFNLDQYTSQTRDNVRIKLGERFSIFTGVDVLVSRSDVLANLPRPQEEGQPPARPDFSQIISTNVTGQVLWAPAAFVEGEIKPGHGLLILPGLRFDYFQRVHQSVLQPRLTTRWALTDRVTVKAGVGLFVQDPPEPWQTNLQFGNPALKSERAWHYSAGAEYKPRPWITLDATGFYKSLTNLVSPTTAVVPDGMGGLRPENFTNGGTGRVIGLELVARHEFSHNFTGWLAYTLSRSTRRDPGSNVDRLFDFDQTHILTVLGSYLLPRNWQIGARFRLVTGNPITPVTGAVFNASSDRYDATYGAVNSARVSTFHQLDVRIDKRWVYQRFMLNLYLDVQNIYNRPNEEGVSYSYNFRQSQAQQGLPILPILGLRAEF